MKKFLSILILSGLFLPVVIGATAAPLPEVGLIVTIERIAGMIFTLLIAISLIVLAYAGFLFVTAGGDAEKVGEARKTITYAILGLIVAGLAWGIRAFLRAQLAI